MSRTFEFTLRVKGCKQEFAEGMGAGVLQIQEIVFEGAPEKDSYSFELALRRQADEILNENVEVIWKETR